MSEELLDAGVCANIGPRERRIRNIAGVVGATLSILVASALIEVHAERVWRLVLALPVDVSAIGFLQARAHTCVAFARKGIRVLGDSRSGAEQVVDDGMRKQIASQARRVYLQTLAVTAAVVLVALVFSSRGVLTMDAYGLSRVVGEPGVLPQRARKLDPSLPLRDGELLIDVESLNIDAASFKQLKDAPAETPRASPRRCRRSSASAARCRTR